jgi:hypothetical protein
MVGMAPIQPGLQTTTQWSNGYENSTTLPYENCYFVTVTSTQNYENKRDKEDEAKQKLAKINAEKMRAGWKTVAKKHDFHQRKWSWNRPRGRR